MRPGMRKVVRMIGGETRTLTKSMLPKLSGVELTKSSWAIHIETCKGVPEVYRSFFEPLLAEGRVFPYTVLTPSHERFIQKQTEKLICVCDHEITILERSGNGFEARCYPVEGISYVEFKTALLSSSFKICGKTRDGSQVASTLIFNSVTDYLFEPVLKTVRLGEAEPGNALQSSVQERFEHLVKVNFKFMNYATHSLLPGEMVIHSVFQPEIRTSKLTVWGRTFYKTTSATHITILTDRELILIREDAVRRKEAQYGGIWDYIPLRKISSLSVHEQTANGLVLTVLLLENTRFELAFQASAAGEVEQLVQGFRQITQG